MGKIWKEKIDELQKIIDSVEIRKDGRLKQLYRKRELLEMAFRRVGNIKL